MLLFLHVGMKAQSKQVYEPILTGDMAMKIAQAAFEEAEKTALRFASLL